MDTNSYKGYPTRLCGIKFDFSSAVLMLLIAIDAICNLCVIWREQLCELIDFFRRCSSITCFQHLGHGWDHFIDWTTMHQSVRTGSGVGVLPAMYSFSGPTSLPQFDFGAPRTSDDLKKVTLYDRYVAVIWGVGILSELKTMRHKLCTC